MMIYEVSFLSFAIGCAVSRLNSSEMSSTSVIEWPGRFKWKGTAAVA